MTISAGKLTQKIFFLDKEENEIKKVHANIIPISAREQLRNGAEIIQDTYTTKIRYTANVSASNLIKWNGSIYEILSMTADKENNEILLTMLYSARNAANFKES